VQLTDTDPDLDRMVGVWNSQKLGLLDLGNTAAGITRGDIERPVPGAFNACARLSGLHVSFRHPQTMRLTRFIG